MDDPDKMEMALNADFDSSLLTCWDSNPAKSDGRRGGAPSMSHHRHGSGGDGGASWDSRSSPRFARLPSFTMEDGEKNNAMELDSSTSVSKDRSSSSKNHAHASTGQETSSNNNHQTNNHTPAPASFQTTTSEVTNNTTQMHPLAIPSSANCPPHVVNVAHQAGHVQMQTMMGIQNALFPMGLTQLGGPAAAFAAGLSLPSGTINQGCSNPVQQQQQQQQASSQQDGKQMQQQQQMQFFTTGNNNNSGQQQQPSQQQQQQNNANSNNNGTAQQNGTPPPFYLFDAPVELRVNFMQSQRMHGIPVTEDSNSYHYGVSVNGFHPQQLTAQHNSNTISNSSSAASSSGTSVNHSVQLVDARHGNRKAGRIKNEREQRRAQKITELIDQLRDKMEKGGWKIEVKSKFHTLASCADYVKHLIKETKDKEEAVCKAKSDLQMKERKVEEEKALQQESRSEPESVMSSLTASTNDSGTSSKMHTTKKVSSENSSDDRQRKRKSSSDGSTSNKKSRKAMASEHSGSSESSHEERDSQQLNQQSLDKASSSVSDVTESNKGSSSSGNDSNQRSEDEDDASGTPSSISASSNAAVVDGKKHCTKHADVVIKERSSERQHKFPTEVTSIEESFVLDYQEVFVKSNVPQIIATTAGRIVAWNDFFLKATGFSRSGAKGLTIFSLVKQDKLSNLFEIVAKALRDEKPTNESASDGASSSESAEGQKWDYKGVTLPCMEFPSASKDRSASGKAGVANPLFVTVTLMADEDPRKRLFHCVLTDCPGTNGTLGSITPELLSLLFTRHHRKLVDQSESRKGDKAGQKV